MWAPCAGGMSARCYRAAVLGLAVWLGMVSGVAARDLGQASQTAELSREIACAKFLVLPPVGHYGRTPLHTDLVEYSLNTGQWKAPLAGDTIEVKPGLEVAWKSADAGDDGWLRSDALRGGYAYCEVESDTSRVMLLQARGPSTIYVNGEPRIGDPYDTGWLRLPVQLRKGQNQFLFHVGHGKLRAKLVAPQEGPASLDLKDTTLPHVLFGDPGPHWGAVVLVNAVAEPLADIAIVAELEGMAATRTELVPLTPLSMRKVAFRFDGAVKSEASEVELILKLVQKQQGEDRVLSTRSTKLAVRLPYERHDRTFVSQIDGSVQYYTVQPADSSAGDTRPGLLLTLHGPMAEASRQVTYYSAKPFAHVVAPTNRRPWGFDWEDWGRLDALEVLGLARERYNTDPRRTYVSGHSMGGHGTWHLGVTYPDKFAAIGPSAAWLSFWSYGRMPTFEPATPIHQLLQRGTNSSDTLKLLRNTGQDGVYLLHGEADTDVPVAQARLARDELGKFHSNFVYYERPAAGHWWSAATCDWPAMMEFFQRQSIPTATERKHIEFITANPGVSAWSHWVGIESQTKQLEFSKVTIDQNLEQRKFVGRTENVAVLVLDVAHLEPGKPVQVELDGEKIEDITWPGETKRIWLARSGRHWNVVSRFTRGRKRPQRYGTFKDAFRNRMLFVYGTQGTAAENAWALAKARFDAEAFWYRGNGSIDVVPDTDFQANVEQDRNVIVYGNADTNAAWQTLLGDSPVEVRRDRVQVGERAEFGDDLACLFIRPRPNSEVASVGVVAGTGLSGLRSTNNLKYFLSGVAYPDLFIFGAKAIKQGTSDIRALGYFGLDWGLETGEIVWRDIFL